MMRRVGSLPDLSLLAIADADAGTLLPALPATSPAVSPRAGIVRVGRRSDQVSNPARTRNAASLPPIFSSDTRAVRFQNIAHSLQDWVSTASATEFTGRQSAANAIESAFTADAPHLTLNQRSLTSLPDCLHHLHCLKVLDVGCNPLTSLPFLPASLQKLSTRYCRLSTLPPLPQALCVLDVSGNQITFLPNLPDLLRELNVHGNALTELPILPLVLQKLVAGNNELSHLPELPPNLETLEVNNNRLYHLPALPNSIRCLQLSDNHLQTLSLLPENLTLLFCANNNLTTLPALPDQVQVLYVSHNALTHLPELPSSLQVLHAEVNSLQQLPNLPQTVTTLQVAENSVTFLPELPLHLEKLNVSGNLLQHLVGLQQALPETLRGLSAQRNQLATLPKLPENLEALDVTHNNLAYLPALPNRLQWLFVQHNPLQALPLLPASLLMGTINPGLKQTSIQGCEQHIEALRHMIEHALFAPAPEFLPSVPNPIGNLSVLPNHILEKIVSTFAPASPDAANFSATCWSAQHLTRNRAHQDTALKNMLDQRARLDLMRTI